MIKIALAALVAIMPITAYAETMSNHKGHCLPASHIGLADVKSSLSISLNDWDHSDKNNHPIECDTSVLLTNDKMVSTMAFGDEKNVAITFHMTFKNDHFDIDGVWTGNKLEYKKALGQCYKKDEKTFVCGAVSDTVVNGKVNIYEVVYLLD